MASWFQNGYTDHRVLYAPVGTTAVLQPPSPLAKERLGTRLLRSRQSEKIVGDGHFCDRFLTSIFAWFLLQYKPNCLRRSPPCWSGRIPCPLVRPSRPHAAVRSVAELDNTAANAAYSVHLQRRSNRSIAGNWTVPPPTGRGRPSRGFFQDVI